MLTDEIRTFGNRRCSEVADVTSRADASDDHQLIAPIKAAASLNDFVKPGKGHLLRIVPFQGPVDQECSVWMKWDRSDRPGFIAQNDAIGFNNRTFEIEI